MHVVVNQIRSNGKQDITFRNDEGDHLYSHRIHIIDADERERLIIRVTRDTGLPAEEVRAAIESGLVEYHAAIASAAIPSEPSHRVAYRVVDNRIYLANALETPLTNFTARISEEIVVIDGEKSTGYFVIEGVTANGDLLASIRILTQEYEAMAWVIREWGASAVITAGRPSRDHVRAAILLLSSERTKREIYCHLGWRRRAGEWIFQTADGAISTNGFIDSETAEIPKELSRYSFPELAPLADSSEAIRASLRLLDVARDEISVPLLAAAFRAPVGQIDVGLHLHGRTGTFKSSVAALFQQHFGVEMDALHLPFSWLSTSNALVKTLHTAKDVMSVVDDFAPNGTPTDIARMNRKAEEVFRSLGNSQGRGRMGPDTSLRDTYWPRGLVVSTGELPLPMESIQARSIHIEVGADDIHRAQLTAAQRDAGNGNYARCMAFYIQAIAGRYEEFQRYVGRLRTQVRNQMQINSSAHARTSWNVAELMLGMHLFLDFALASRAINHAEYESLYRRCFTALRSVGLRQSLRQRDQDQAVRVLTLVWTAISMGRAHLALRGRHTTRQDGYGNGPEGPLGACGGYLHDGSDVYLDPNVCIQLASMLGREQGCVFTITPSDLARRLFEKGYLVEEVSQNTKYHRLPNGCDPSRSRGWLRLRPGVLETISEGGQEDRAFNPNQEGAPGLAATDILPGDSFFGHSLLTPSRIPSLAGRGQQVVNQEAEFRRYVLADHLDLDDIEGDEEPYDDMWEPADDGEDEDY